MKVWEGVASAKIRSPETGLNYSYFYLIQKRINNYYSTTAVGGNSEKSKCAELQQEVPIMSNRYRMNMCLSITGLLIFYN